MVLKSAMQLLFPDLCLLCVKPFEGSGRAWHKSANQSLCLPNFCTSNSSHEPVKNRHLKIPAHCSYYLNMPSQGLALISQCGSRPPSLLVRSRLPLPPTPPGWGSHCVFITIKESPAGPAIRPHYSVPHLLTPVTL